MRKLEITITEDKILKEFKRIQKGIDNGYSTNYSWNESILYFQWKEFYKEELKLWNENKLRKGLPLQSWIYFNRKRYIGKDATNLTDREILRAFKISGVHIGNSQHSPFYIQQFIKDYNIKSIYDCCGGWGHRLLGAYNIKYIYNDINSTTYNNCISMNNYFNLQDKYFYNNNSAEFTPEEDYEAVFTCPPYYNIEIYTEKGAENLSYKQFLYWWEQTINASCVNKRSCKYFAFIINSTYLEDMKNVCLNTGLKLVQKIKLGKNNKNHFQRIAKQCGKGEYLVILQK